MPVLRHVSGLGAKLAEALVATRDTKGGFKSREDLREIPGAAPKTFEQCAGFLRVLAGSNPLDATAIHPESYPVAEAMAAAIERHGQGPRRERGTAGQTGPGQVQKRAVRRVHC